MSPSGPPPEQYEQPTAGSEPNPDDVDEVDDGNRNIIFAIIAQLRPGADLARITLPTFILERKSMLERITNIMQHPSMLIQAASLNDPVERFLGIVRWYMSGWHIAPKAVKKPLNPVLGEYFSCYWNLPDGSKAYYVAEQTSHHPPKSSYFFEIPAHDIHADGLLLPRSRFLGNSAASMMEGIGYITLKRHNNETYTITQPNIYARGILLGTLKLEMGDTASVVCEQLDMRVDIKFKVKGFINGTYHAIAGTIMHKGKPLYELSGKWNETMYVKDLKTNQSEVLFDCLTDQPERPCVRPIAEQGEYESRRLWQKVVQALSRRDHDLATTEKLKIEDAQRELARMRQETGEAFMPKLFAPEDSPVQYRLFVDPALENATPEEADHIIRSAMPIFPGDKFPDDFHEPAALKRQAVVKAISTVQQQQARQQPVSAPEPATASQNPKAAPAAAKSPRRTPSLLRKLI